MSRNKEKAESALNRFQQEQKRQAGVLESNPNLRPKYVQKEQSLPQAEKWRSVVMNELSVMFTKIQDPLLDDDDLRELNESINKLFREQRAWEYHIKSLGGPDYIKFGKDLQSTGLSDGGMSNIKGFRYYGRAKELSEVRQLLELRKETFNNKQSRDIRDDQENKVLETQFANLNPFYFVPLTSPNIYNEIVDQVDGHLTLRSITDELQYSNSSSSIPDKYDLSTIDKELLKDLKSQSTNTPVLESEIQTKVDNLIDYEHDLPSSEDAKEYVIQKKKQQLLSKYSSPT